MHPRPILQLSVLELLTPVVQVGDIKSIARPEAGQLFKVLKCGQHIPWVYATQGLVRGPFSKLMEQSEKLVLFSHSNYVHHLFTHLDVRRRDTEIDTSFIVLREG